MASLETLVDDFNNVDSTKWQASTSSGNYTITNGALALSATSSLGVATLTSWSYFTLDNSSVKVKLVSRSSTVLSRLALVSNSGVNIYIGVSPSNQLNLWANDGNGNTRISWAGTYNAATMVWLRIRMTGGVLYMETSPDDVTYTVQANYSGFTANPGGYQVQLLHQGNGSTRFDLLNGGAPSISTLTDDFTGPALDTTKWTPSNNVAIVNQQLNLVGGSSFPQVVSVSGYSINDSAAFVKVVSAGTGTVSFYLQTTSASGFYAQFYLLGGTQLRFYASSSVSTYTSPTRTFDPVADAWWRLRHANGIMYFETSPDGTTWAQRGSTAFEVPTTDFKAYLVNQSNNTTAVFDNFNVPPPPTPSISTLTDQFTGTTLDPAKWTPASSGATYSVSGGLLWLNTLANAPNGAVTVTSASAYNIVDGSVYAKISPSQVAGTLTSFTVQNAAGTGFVQVRCNPPAMQLTALKASGGYAVQNYTFGAWNAASWAYWRIRCDSAGAWYIDRSTDATTWTVLYNLGDMGFREQVKVLLEMVNNNVAVAGTSSYDSVNVVATATVEITATPTGITDVDTAGTPSAAWSWATTPASIADTDTVTGPDGTYLPYPDSIIDGEIIDAPSAAWSMSTELEPVTDTDTTGTPTVSMYPLPDSLVDNVSIGTPDVFWMPDKLYPGTITDVGPLGTPTVTFKAFYTGGYGQGPYGMGLYSGMWIGLDPIVDPDTLGTPEVDTRPKIIVGEITDPEIVGTPALSGNAVGTDIIPASLADDETLDAPQVTFVGADLYGMGLYGQGLYGVGQFTAPVVEAPDEVPPISNYGYGAGTYGEGLYAGQPGQVTDANPADNPTYGSGTYGYGIYYGEHITVRDAVPLFTNIAGQFRPAMHILGIGPWSTVVNWRGAANYSVPGGNRPSRPAMAMPATTSKGFRLRLNDGGEARAELSLRRGSAVIIDEMDTDLWWRRKDPRTKQLEVIGRFNTSHVSTSTSDTGVRVSLQFDDYRTLLGARMILRYKNDKTKETMWDTGTPVTTVLAWALPDNANIDYSEVTGADPYPLGKLTRPYDLPPGTTIEEVMDQLNAISPIRWEWWVETPLDIDQRPKLRFQLGTIGLDKGVVLHDLGKGPSPIASWTRNGAADNYANSLMYSGSDGSVVEQIDADIDLYGQRDAQASNSTLDGTQMALLRLGAKRKLEKLSNRQPTYTINLAQGFWRGRSHIDVGDTVTLLIRLGKERVYEKYRVTEIAVDIDDVGMEEVTVTLGTPLASADGRSKKSPLMRIVRYLKEYAAPKGSLDIPTLED